MALVASRMLSHPLGLSSLCGNPKTLSRKFGQFEEEMNGPFVEKKTKRMTININTRTDFNGKISCLGKFP